MSGYSGLKRAVYQLEIGIVRISLVGSGHVIGGVYMELRCLF